MAELGQMPTHGMNGFILLVNLLISNTSKLYKYMQHTSWPTVCGTNTHLFQSLFSHLSCFTKCACSLERFQSHAVAHVGKRRWQFLGGHHHRPSPKPPLTYYHVRPDAREENLISLLIYYYYYYFVFKLKLPQNKNAKIADDNLGVIIFFKISFKKIKHLCLLQNNSTWIEIQFHGQVPKTE